MNNKQHSSYPGGGIHATAKQSGFLATKPPDIQPVKEIRGEGDLFRPHRNAGRVGDSRDPVKAAN
jgi:hypothetical protein